MKPATILIVDDTPANLRFLVKALQNAGYATLVAANGEWALQQVERSKPDLIILDVLMPGIDGFETCRRLKANEQTRDIPVIFMTALSETVNKVKGFGVGGVDYITKPFEQEEVLARVNAHLTIVRQQRQLEDLNAAKDKFLTILAHDLRSPFSSLRMMIHFMAEHLPDIDPTSLESTLHLLERSTDNIHMLLENLLTWARIQRGVMDYAPQLLDVSELVTRNVELLRPTADQKQISLEQTLPEAIPAQADPAMIDAVIRNLLANALKFTDAGGRVTVSATCQEQQVRIAVSDTGTGIPAEHLPKLFRIDVKYRQVGTAREKGTGFGLILCKEFVAQHGGTIQVESQEGKGSTFTVTLPLHV